MIQKKLVEFSRYESILIVSIRLHEHNHNKDHYCVIPIPLNNSIFILSHRIAALLLMMTIGYTYDKSNE